MSFQYFCFASCNNNVVFVGFSLICLESLGFLYRNWKSFVNFLPPPPSLPPISSHPFFLSLPLLKKLNPSPFWPILRKSIPSCLCLVRYILPRAVFRQKMTVDSMGAQTRFRQERKYFVIKKHLVTTYLNK